MHLSCDMANKVLGSIATSNAMEEIRNPVQLCSIFGADVLEMSCKEIKRSNGLHE